MARRRPPFIQVLGPAMTLFGIAACTAGKRHDDGTDEGLNPEPSETEETAEETGDTGEE